MDKFDIANKLREIGLLLNAQGGNVYKARAYLNGARAVESISEDINTVISEGRLTEIPSIGQSLAKSIVEIHQSGHSNLGLRLQEELPPGIIELSEINGLTTRRIQKLHSELDISSIDELESACKSGLVSKIKGFGEKVERQILEGIASYKNSSKSVLLYEARELARQVEDYLQASIRPGRMTVAGQVRRWCEVVSTIAIVAQTDKPDEAVQAIEKFPLVTAVEDAGQGYCRLKLSNGLTLECTFTSSQAYHLKLLQCTGSPEHYAALQRLAAEMSLELTGDRFTTAGGDTLPVFSEADVYKRLGLNFVPEEMRNGLDELELALNDDFSDLIKIEDIRGMTHCHTTNSDGRNSVMEMAQAAAELGMQYLTITDHSPSAHYAGGLEIEKLKEQWREIEHAQKETKIQILKGTESDITQEGNLDYPDDVLDKFDIVIASVHNRFKLNPAQMTERLLRCMRNPHFKIWGHPLGQLLLKREPIKCDVEKVLDAIAESRAAIEINGDPHRMDLAPQWVRLAKKRGIKLIISTDAHSTSDMGNLIYGIHLARRAGVRKSDVLNTLPQDEFADFVRPALLGVR